jgi:hypothetical protein
MPSTSPHEPECQRRIPAERLAEITSWLQKRISPEEVIAALDADDAIVKKPAMWERLVEGLILLVSGLWIILLYRRIVDGSRRASSEYFREWLVNHDLSSAELWEYDTAGDSWENLQGECGFAIVRDGVIVDFWMYMMN